MNLYTLNNDFIEKTNRFPSNFTGIVEWFGSTKEWYLNGKLHRLEGPAVEYPDGTKEWGLNGKLVTKKQHKLYVDMLKLKGLL